MDCFVFKGCTSLEQVIFEDPSNWGQLELTYDPAVNQSFFVNVLIEEDLSNPETAAQLLTSTYLNEILQKIE